MTMMHTECGLKQETVMPVESIRRDIAELKRYMKTAGIKRTSCFNGGLSQQAYQANAKVFELETALKTAIRKGEQ